MKYTVKRIDTTLDEIVFNYYGSSFNYLELVLSANIFLYTEPIYLTVGTVIELPEIEQQAEQRVSLWN